MTTKELYEYVGGNYEAALKILRMERMIDRFIQRLTSSQVCEALLAAGETLEPTKMFDTAHAVKGVCANLGLDNLGGIAHELCEEFRPGHTRCLTDDEVKARLEQFGAMYERVKEGLRLFAEGK